MPVNVTRVFGGEKKWRKAKTLAGDKFGDSKKHWRYVMGIYKKLQKAKD